jgi:Tol biopolymer transport system component
VELKAFNTEGDVGPVWSPRGNELAFQARPAKGSPTWIYTVRADGSHERRLARGHRPAWSPDGRRVAFVDDAKLYTIDRDGTHRRKLSRPGELVVAAAWSPRGGTLAYVAGTRPAPGGASNLHVETVSADGKRVRILARASGGASIWTAPPLWTPSGQRIVFGCAACS